MLYQESYFKLAPPKDRYNIVYVVYLLYGISTLLVYNAVLSTIEFYQMEMPNYKPAYILSFGLNLLVVIFLSISMLRGHHLSFQVKNNLMIFLLVPVTLSIPYSAYYI